MKPGKNNNRLEKLSKESGAAHKQQMKCRYNLEHGIYKYEGGKGASIDDAIIIKGVSNERDGIFLEHEYIANLFPKKGIDWKRGGQDLIYAGDKRYDRIQIKLLGGKTRELFFDITGFYGMLDANLSKKLKDILKA
ncbi:MAG: hypothetical protein WC980_06025 [Candidatus Brocadiia bacterium]